MSSEVTRQFQWIPSQGNNYFASYSLADLLLEKFSDYQLHVESQYQLQIFHFTIEELELDLNQCKRGGQMYHQLVFLERFVNYKNSDSLFELPTDPRKDTANAHKWILNIVALPQDGQASMIQRMLVVKIDYQITLSP